MNSGSPYFINVDLEKELANIEREIDFLPNDYSFQKSLVNVFNRLFDAHTLYRMPGGYSRCTLVRPYLIESLINERGEQSFYLRQGVLGNEGDVMWQKVFNFDPREYVNMEIISANGRSSLSYFEWFADNFVGYYKDHSVRFNAAMRRRWSQVPLNMFPIDEGLDLNTTFRLSNGRTISVPNAVMCNSGFNGIDDFLNANLRVRNLFTANMSPDDIIRKVEEFKKEPIEPHKELELFKLYDIPKPTRVETKIFSKRAIKLTSSDGEEIFDIVGGNPYKVSVISQDPEGETTFMLYENDRGEQTPVYKLTTFAPASVKSSLAVLNDLLSYSEKENYKNVIVDMSYNGGGIVCYADLIASMFVEKWGNLSRGNDNAPLGVYDFRQSNITDEFTRHFITWSLYTNPKKYMRISNRTVYEDMSFYTNAQTYRRGGLVSNYTEKSYFPATCIGYPEDDIPGFKPVRYYFDNIFVITDGACGSACSLFLTQLQNIRAAKVVSYGGIKGKSDDMETSSFAGGNVLEWDTVVYAMESTGYPYFPKPFPTSARARYNYHEYYRTKDSILPREFEKIPADYHIDTWGSLYMWDPLTIEGRAQLDTLYEPVEKIMRSII